MDQMIKYIPKSPVNDFPSLIHTWRGHSPQDSPKYSADPEFNNGQSCIF